jgi:hypothetical protein
MMGLAGGVVFPASAVDAQRCGGLHTDNPGHFQITASNTFSMNNLTSTFFTTNPVTALATCSNGSNPAFFWRRH